MTDLLYIVPAETETFVSLTNPARWHAKCVCGQVHDIVYTSYWNEGDEKPVEHWCFICPSHGLHIQLDDKPPYRILKTLQYRSTVAVKLPDELDGDALAEYFE